jgi:hypothetical protein
LNIETARYLWNRIPVLGAPKPRELVMDIVADMLAKGMIESEDEAYAVIGTWDDMGRYNFGVSLRTGWREPGAEFPEYQDLANFIQVLNDPGDAAG